MSITAGISPQLTLISSSLFNSPFYNTALHLWSPDYSVKGSHSLYFYSETGNTENEQTAYKPAIPLSVNAEALRFTSEPAAADDAVEAEASNDNIAQRLDSNNSKQVKFHKKISWCFDNIQNFLY